MDACVTVKNLSKSFGSLAVLEQWNLELGKGERLVILGPSGCGKTTFLRILSGLERPTSGTVEHNHMRIGFVFQESRLIPWRTVEENLRFVNPEGEIKEILSPLKLTGFSHYLPSRLSGGMRQRVNLARALVIHPDLLILDEAFTSLDIKIKLEIMKDIHCWWLKQRFSIIAVTHDLKEALLLADRIAIVTDRPSKIKNIIDVPLGIERKISSSDFIRMESKLLEMM
ncbi:MAG: ABC transporter ATP-binding protein [Chloroflexi bacterium]|nr:ABC transporter ATP-binding protein [Chloroflexota bacterium]